MALMGAQGLQGFANVHDGASAAIALGSFGAAYFMADLATGLYHWGVDNYGSAETPVVGRQIEAFTSHHKHPWTIVEREFCNNVHLVFKPMLPFAAVFAASAHWTPDSWNIWASTFMFLCAMSQQFHAWSHMKASELPAPVLWAQETGLLVSRREHGQHHRAPFEGHYCIVSGFWNKYLDKGGAPDGFFRNLEKAVYDRTGVAPRCWDEPDFDTPDYDYRPGQAAPAQDAAMQ
ncbi:unnamed protein product [Pedinophyceae sp. YPF-701]|nr:unnamed protein product [Pedinophyceae sp. YPF-701]